MKKLLILLFSVALIFTSCEKEEQCELSDFGFLDINNNSDDLYAVYINGTLSLSLSGHTFSNDYELDSGIYDITAEQQTGFIFFPTIVDFTVSISNCQHKSIVIP